MGYYIGLHDYYCQNGYACIKKNRNKFFAKKEEMLRDKKYVSKNRPFQLFIESIIEGFVVTLFVFFIHLGIDNKSICIFTVGISMHIISEILGIHTFFCNDNCLLQL
jgi:hypothetical protein